MHDAEGYDKMHREGKGGFFFNRILKFIILAGCVITLTGILIYFILK